ncbi:hypothetical protein DCAR_0313501 [Daucus carota subsp. sativus]|uniref:Tubulin--tyrosine ligase-like protein 12 SET-like domain-containing protein n=1 Tax=Daucus carota subsp. sativus TaxID=79200 RepID=A0AAF0WTC9_DAUCS|nr:hypothetical protein DCAR_0313501 [Daucus carota subsp. sativus]
MAAPAHPVLTFEQFAKVHSFLLAASGIPPCLYQQLYEKLSSETFDGGDFFQVEPVDDGRQRRLILTSSECMEKEARVFLVDHAWTFRLSDALKQLQEVPGLTERMASLMCVDIDIESGPEEENGSREDVHAIIEREVCKAKDEGSDTISWLELDELAIDDNMLLSLDLPSKFPNLHALSLTDNKLENEEAVVQEITKLKDLRALWLNNNPVSQESNDRMMNTILRGCPRLEIYNSSFTPKFSEWALGFCGGIYSKDNPGFIEQTDGSLRNVVSLDLSNRCIHSLANKAFCPQELPSLSYLNLRGNPLDQTSVSDLLQLIKAFDSLHALEVDIPGPLGDSVTKILEYIPKLSLINGVDTLKILESGKSVMDSVLQPRLPDWSAEEPLSDRVINAMWFYLMNYRLADEEKIDETSVWYVMDELGSALRHSDEANFRVAPFLYMPEGTLNSALSFSILWPTKTIQSGEECTRDFLYGIGEEKQRSARLTAWFHTPKSYFVNEYENYREKLKSSSFSSQTLKPSSTRSLVSSGGTTLRVYTDIPQVEEFLTRPEFVITSDSKDADIIWTAMQVDEEMKKATGIHDQQYINQFPYEACLVMKHHLAETIQKAHGLTKWFQPTYNLEGQLTPMIGDYLVREEEGLDNLWILKPWNMARTIDTTVTGNLTAIIRLMETGPKICQKYIEHPALFKGKKFDLRYIVLLRSLNPLELFLADIFWVRLANNSYTLDKHSLYEYETHFTVMNYGRQLNHMNTPEFVKEFEQEHQVNWLDIHARIRGMIKSAFESAALVHPEMHNPMSRAMYGVDVMLDTNFQPKLLEVTYCPDCNRACKYDTKSVLRGETETVKGQDFYNYVFGCLFLNETAHVSQL